MKPAPRCPRCGARLFIENGEDGRSWHCPSCGYDKSLPVDKAEMQRVRQAQRQFQEQAQPVFHERPKKRNYGQKSIRPGKG